MHDELLPKLPNQLVGNIGLFYVCYVLSREGWNCLPTSRNAKGIDLVIYSQDANKMHTIQVGRESTIGCYLYNLFLYATWGVAKWAKEVQSLDSWM